ncbi:MAG: hypothetical protein Q8N91_01215, partial [Candidatus Omnitrophota bacterium]|nr:hypothetical protein [Candidatus Omnitrophota bacterium]
MFHALYANSRIPYALINVCLLFTALTACFYSSISSLTLMALSWLFLYPVSVLYYRIDYFNAALPVFVFNCLQIGFLCHRDIIKQEAASRDMRLSERDAERIRISKECELFSRIENNVRDKELAIVSLYEITKKMSASLKFDDIFKVFSEFLNENFIFRRCELLILDAESALPRPGRIYSAWSPRTEKKVFDKIDYDKLINLFSEHPQKMYVSKAEDRQFFRNFWVDSEEAETFTGIPLLDGEKLLAVLLAENLSETDPEKFGILSMELSLEIRKVLLYEMVERL